MGRFVFGAAFVGSMLVAACGVGAGAKAVRPDMPNGGDALGGGKCVDEPWVVDLTTSDIDKLTTALGNGVAVVGHDCGGLKILQNCTAPRGRYEYEGKPSLAETKQLNDADEIKAELATGAILGPKLSSDLKRGISLDIAYTHVGTSSTTARVGRTDLKETRPGGCQGATHIVEAVLLGAYQMKGSTSAEVSASLEAFKQGIEAKSASSAINTKTGGKATECGSAKEGDKSPVSGCRFPLQIRLAALEQGSIHGGAGSPPPPPPPRITGATARTCRPGDYNACTTSCERIGDGASCALLGFMFEKGKGGAPTDPRRAADAYKRGCDKRNLDACAGLGTLYSKGEGVSHDDAQADRYLGEGCSRLNGRACSSLGNRARKMGKTPEALSYLTRACNLGYGRACFYAGSLSLENRDVQGAYRLSQQGCSGADLRGCLLEASMMINGHGTAANPSEGNALKARSLAGLEAECSGHDNEACEVLGSWHMGMYENPQRDTNRAATYFQKACDRHEERACEEAKHARSGGTGNGPMASAPPQPSPMGGPSRGPSPQPMGGSPPSRGPSSQPMAPPPPSPRGPAGRTPPRRR